MVFETKNHTHETNVLMYKLAREVFRGISLEIFGLPFLRSKRAIVGEESL